MRPRGGLRLCTFEVATHLGRHSRVGAERESRIIDLNFAVAWYMAQTGEPEPQKLADALVPPEMGAFLRSGLRAMYTAEELFLGSGPQPDDWWKLADPPRGPNCETLVYDPAQVRPRPPLDALGCLKTVGPNDTLPWSEGDDLKPKLAAVGGAYVMPGRERRDLAGYTLLIATRGCAAMGPYIVTPNAAGDLEQVDLRIQVDGVNWFTGKADSLRAALNGRESLAAGEIVASNFDAPPPAPLKIGSVIEIDAGPIGVLRTRLGPAGQSISRKPT